MINSLHQNAKKRVIILLQSSHSYVQQRKTHHSATIMSPLPGFRNKGKLSAIIISPLPGFMNKGKLSATIMSPLPGFMNKGKLSATIMLLFEAPENDYVYTVNILPFRRKKYINLFPFIYLFISLFFGSNI